MRGRAVLFLSKIAKGQHKGIHLTFPVFSMRPSQLLLLLQWYKSTGGISLTWTHLNLFKKRTSPEPSLSAYLFFFLLFLMLYLYNCFLICLFLSSLYLATLNCMARKTAADQLLLFPGPGTAAVEKYWELEENGNSSAKYFFFLKDI